MPATVPLIRSLGAAEVVAALIAFLSTLAVALRLWVRIRLTQKAHWDDAWLVLSQFFLLFLSITFIVVAAAEGYERSESTAAPYRLWNTVSSETSRDLSLIHI